MGTVSWMRGDYEAAIKYHQRALDAGRTSGMTYLQASAMCALGTAYLDVSPEFADRVAELHTEAVQVIDMPLGTATGAMSWADLGFCAMALGDLDGAEQMFQKGLTSPSAPMYMMRPRILVGSTFVALARGNLEEAAKCARGAGDLAKAAEMKHYYAMVAFAEAQVPMASGDTETALTKFDEADELANEIQMRPLIWQARASAAGLLSAAGRTDEAEAKMAGAKAAIDEIASLFSDDELRAKYLSGVEAQLAS
jgi:tetratricopeptide (TPR) repeat protein